MSIVINNRSWSATDFTGGAGFGYSLPKGTDTAPAFPFGIMSDIYADLALIRAGGTVSATSQAIVASGSITMTLAAAGTVIQGVYRLSSRSSPTATMIVYLPAPAFGAATVTFTVLAATGSGSYSDWTLAPLVNYSAGGSLPRGYLTGLALTSNGTTPATDLDLAVGSARSGGNTADMVLATALTAKRLSSVWSAGSGGGLLDTGSVTANSWYHLHLISNGIAVDLLASLSATAPLLPPGYVSSRRIGSVYYATSIRPFAQIGDIILYPTMIQDVFATGTGTSAVVRTVSVPTGVRVQALMRVVIHSDSVLVTALDESDQVPDSDGYGGLTTVRMSGNGLSVHVACLTTTAAQLRTRCGTGTTGRLGIYTYGYIDDRGKLA